MSQFASIIAALVNTPAKQLRSVFGKTGADAKNGMSTQAIVVIGILCAVLPFDISQLVFMVLGACCYWLVQSTSAPMNKKSKKVENVTSKLTQSVSDKPPAVRPWRHDHLAPLRKPTFSRSQMPAVQKVAPQKETRSSTSMPILAPVIKSTGWEAEVAELLDLIMPTPESNRVVQELASQVKHGIRRIFPEADVVGFATGDFRRGKAFGVAVPEVDIIINIKPEVLATRLHCRLKAGPEHPSSSPDDLKLQKSAIRMITDSLVSKGGFKFRRSAFRGLEPKVTVLSPVLPRLVDEAVPLDLSVNAHIPFHNMALLTESSRLQPLARELILLVRRWAKDRGICHAAKGHLPPYQWSLLALYFLQVGADAEEPLLPPFECSMVGERVPGGRQEAKVVVSKTAATWSAPGRSVSAAELFKRFAHFYHAEFKWTTESVSICAGRRTAPSLKLATQQASRAALGPTIEDPFDATNNLGRVMNPASLARLHEELARAHELCEREASVTELLQLWTPPDTEDAAPVGGDDM